LTAGKQGIGFIPGIEIDCHYRGTDLHLLGYQFDLGADIFDDLEKSVAQKHMDAVPQMIINLEREGFEMDQQELAGRTGGKPPSAELMAELLLLNPGQQFNPRLKPYRPGGKRGDMPLINFYLDFFAQGKPAYVKMDHLDFKVALEMVRDSGGIPIVAHPGLNLEGREGKVNELMELGAAGLEVFNNYHTRKQSGYFAELVRKRGALMTCGSDFHGKNKPLISIGQYNGIGNHGTYLENSLATILNFPESDPNHS
jgi:predicted metal-dependent phosphoesterase TrpH